MAFAACLTGEAQKSSQHLLPNMGTTFAAQQVIPYTESGDKSRIIYSVVTTNTLGEQLYGYKQEVVERLSLITPLLATPQDKDDFLFKLNRLDILLPALRTSLAGLAEVLSRFTERQIDVPYRVALYPALRYHADGDRSLLSLGVTCSDETVALDVMAQYLRLYPSDEGVSLFAKHDMTPGKHAASRALQALGEEVRRLSSGEFTRLITGVRQIAEAVTELKSGIQPMREGVYELRPLVEEFGHDPLQIEQLRNRYDTLVAPFARSIGAMQNLFGERGEEFDDFFSRFRAATQEARRSLVSSALTTHFALTGGVRSFRRLGRSSATGVALAQQVPLASGAGILWNVSAQYVWLQPENGRETSGTLWGFVVAWMDKLSSFNHRGEPVLRRWQWQVGLEYHPPGALLEGSAGAFVRWRPTGHLEDYLLFWMRDGSGQNMFGLGVRWMFGVERY